MWKRAEEIALNQEFVLLQQITELLNHIPNQNTSNEQTENGRVEEKTPESQETRKNERKSSSEKQTRNDSNAKAHKASKSKKKERKKDPVSEEKLNKLFLIAQAKIGQIRSLINFE